MMAIQEIPPTLNAKTTENRAILADVYTRLRNNKIYPETAREFFDYAFTHPNDQISPDTLSHYEPAWKKFMPICSDSVAFPCYIGLRHPDFELSPAAKFIIFPDSPSTGGKTVTTQMVIENVDHKAILVPTIYGGLPKRQENKINPSFKLRMGDSEIEALYSGQYVYVSPENFQKLTKIPDFFIEHVNQFGIQRGVARPILKTIADQKQEPFMFCILNQDGQKSVINWLKVNIPQIKPVRVFYLPTEISASGFLNNIIELRRNENPAERVADAIMDLITAPLNSDIILYNPYDKKHGPKIAVFNTLFLMKILKPEK